MNQSAPKTFSLQRHLIAILAVLVMLAASKLTARPPTTAPVAQAPMTQMTLHFKDAPAEDVLHAICSAGGYALIESVPVDGRLTFVKDQPISPEQALELMSGLLKDRGYVVVLENSVVKIDIRARL